ncbi:MAG: heavy-metal-associated domain-containing protein [Dehalococcoidia bacterium]
MPQVTLYAPDITCDHCIATISKAVATVDGARFIAGDPEAKTFAVEVASGAVLDRVAETLAAEGYPLGDAPAAPAVPADSAAQAAHMATPGMPMAGAPIAMAHAPGAAAGMHGMRQIPHFKPQYLKVERTEAGADVTYSCPCGSTTEVFQLDRSQADQQPHSCCGHHTLVGPNAEARLRDRVGDGYEIDVQTVTMPWGQPVEAAQAVRKG